MLIDTIDFTGALGHHSGKVRESFLLPENKRAIVVTDRVSSFDFILGKIPKKGAVLNQIAAWWFQELDKIGVRHHLLDVPHPNISITKNATVLPVEIVVRGYLTGTTKTSSWYAYQNLDRKICGISMPDNMKKNEAFPTPIITPTTKPEEGHDEAISREEILERGLVSSEIYAQAEEYALKMFAHGQKIAEDHGLILVDTKYEMGVDQDGNLMVVDEVHTPDSSRYWVAESYEEKMAAGQEPEGLDKEFVRRMVVESGYNVDDESQDPADFFTDKIAEKASEKYQVLFGKMTGKNFDAEQARFDGESVEAVLGRYV